MTDLQPKPQLEDPLHEKEIFSNDVVGVGMMHGNLVITLANIRFDESSGTESPKMRRVVSARLVLSNNAGDQLLRNLQNSVTQMQAMAAKAGNKPPS